MGTIAEIRKVDRSLDCENFLAMISGKWVMKLLVRDPVKVIQPKVIDPIEKPEEDLPEEIRPRIKER